MKTYTKDDLMHVHAVDVSHDLLRQAHYNTSFSPDQRADGHINDYMATMERVAAEFAAWATEQNIGEMRADLEKWRARYVTLLHDWAHSHANVASQAITGSGGWTPRMVQTNNKRCDAADRKRGLLLEHTTKRLEKLRSKYDQARIDARPIMAGDDDAIERLNEKIASLENQQALYKAANKIIRSKKLADDEKFASLQALGLPKQEVVKVMTPDYMGRVGFPSFRLSNNNAKIRTAKARLQEVQRLAEMPTTEEEVGAVRVVDNTDASRVQVFFPDKPSAEIRTALKSSGFRWAPSVGAWQAYRKQCYLEAGRRIAEQYEGDA